MENKKKGFRLQLKFLIGLVALAIVLVVALTSVVVVQYRGQMEQHYSKIAFDEAAIAAELIDGDTIERYYKTGVKDDYYEQISKYLLTVKQNVGLEYFYVVVPEDDVMVYIWDSGTEGEEGVCDLLDSDAYYGGGDELMHDAFSVDAKRNILITNNDEYGYLASAYVPILDSQGVPVALSSVDIRMEKINQDIRNFVFMSVLVAGIALLIAMVAYYYYIRKLVIRPVGILNQEVSHLIQNEMENLETFSIELKTGDELEELADAFQYMTVELSGYIRNLTRITAEKERIGAELDVAAKIQSDMLPCIFPAFPERHEFDIYATMTPAKEVGGDFYDFFLVDDDHLAMVMADVSGKGVPAALFMMISKTLLKSAAQAGLSPKAVLEQVNNQLCENNEAEMFVTVWLGILEISTGTMVCANAGHEYPAIRRKDSSFELYKDKHGLVLAGMEHVKYKEYELKLQPGDAIFVYTDGVAEATDADNVLYGTDRMIAALNQHPGGNCRELLETVHGDVDAFVGEAPQFDDITMLCLQLLPQEAADGAGASDVPQVEADTLRVRPEMDTMDEVTAFVEQLLEQAEVPMATVMKMNIAVDEVYSNIIRYSGASEVCVRCRVADGQVELTFTDNGTQYDPLQKEDPDITLSADEREIGGLGIFMVKQTMDEVTYEYQDGCNVLKLVKEALRYGNVFLSGKMKRRQEIRRKTT